MPDQRTGDRHAEQPLTVRFGTDRSRLEDYSDRTGLAVRRIVRDAVRHWLDKHAPETTQITEEQQ